MIWDAEVATQLAAVIRDNGWENIGVIFDKNLKGLLEMNDVWSRLQECGTVQMFEQGVAEPDTDYADELTAQIKANPPEVLVGIGGGSILDLTKGVAVLLTNPGKAADYQGFNLVKTPGLPIIAIPTTAGTGSEVTWTAVFTNRSKLIKGGINSPHCFPRFAILDPKLTVSMPRRVTLSSGMDALSHAVESYTAKNASLLSRALSVQGAQLLYEGLSGVFRDESDLKARHKTQLGSTIAGWACFNAGTGACHSLAYPLGVYFGVPHGEALSMLLPTVVRINDAKQPGLYSSLWTAVFGNGHAGAQSETEKSKLFMKEIDNLCAQSNLRLRLSDYGMAAKDLDSMSEKAINLKSALLNNPVEFSQSDARRALESIL